MQRFADQAGREITRFEIAAILTPDSDPDVVRRFEDVGVDRVALTLPEIENADEARRALELLASKVF
jgi:hypothetical protein